MRRSQVLLTATIAFGVLYAAGAAALGTPPEVGDSGTEVAAWFQAHGDDVRLWMWTGALALMAFGVFATLVRTHLPPLHRDLFTLGAIAFMAETAVQGWFWLGLALHGADLDPATARTLLDIAIYWGPVLTTTTVFTLAPIAILGLRREPPIPFWLGVLSGIALVEQLLETVTILGRSGFTAPGGPMNLLLGAGLTAISWLSLGVVLSRRPDPVLT